MNYLLFVGLALFSSACGALLVTLLRVRRRGSVHTWSRPGAEPSSKKVSST